MSHKYMINTKPWKTRSDRISGSQPMSCWQGTVYSIVQYMATDKDEDEDEMRTNNYILLCMSACLCM